MPNISQHERGLSKWSEEDIEHLLATGELPDGDAVSGDMAKVVREISQLSADDRRAMAHYLKSLPPVARAAAAVESVIGFIARETKPLVSARRSCVERPRASGRGDPVLCRECASPHDPPDSRPFPFPECIRSSAFCFAFCPPSASR